MKIVKKWLWRAWPLQGLGAKQKMAQKSRFGDYF